jgi:hypothetical protein
MKPFNTVLYGLTVLGLLVFQTACKKEDDSYQDFPIKLTVKDTVGSTKLIWTKIESSDFIEYVIVRSTKDPITNFSDLNTSAGAFIMSRISNAKQVEAFDFNNNSFNLTSKLHYRVFARLKNRTLSSENFTYNSDIFTINTQPPSEIIQDENNPNLVYFNATNSGQILLYNLEKDTIEAKIFTNGTSSKLILASDKGKNTELIFFSTYNRKIYFYDAQTLQLKTTMDFPNYVYNVTSSQDGFIAIFTDEYNKQIQIVRLSDHKVVSTNSSTINNTYNFYSSTWLSKFPTGNTVLLVENSSSPMVAKMTHDALGTIINNQFLGRIISSNSSNGVKISPKGNYLFINGQIYAEPLDINKPINLFLQGNFESVFNSDDTKFYTFRQNFNGGIANMLEEYGLPDGKLLRTLSPKLVGRLVIYKNKAYIFGQSNSSSSQMVLQKVQL